MDDEERLLIDPLTERETEILGLMEKGNANRDIAEQLFLTLDTVKWYNKRIYNKLGVHNRTQAISRMRSLGILEDSTDPVEIERTEVKHNLPAQLSSFIGRHQEIMEIKGLLGENRLLTLSGPPGTGKSRLALRIAREVMKEYPDGVYFIDLAPIDEPQYVLSSIARVFGLKETSDKSMLEMINNHIRTKSMLIILDNFEHLIDAGPTLSDLLSSTEQVKIVVTSREVLQIYGEQEYSVTPLNLPLMDDAIMPVDLGEVEAVQLFIHRARAVRSGWEATEEELRAIADICIQLDGLPLPIELAAARIKMLTPQMILDLLTDRLGTLVGGARDLPHRLQTLRGTIDWSYELLDENEKEIFARMAVFRGGRTVDGLRALCYADLCDDLLDGLESLLNKSLISQKESSIGEPRFVLLETIHEYAREKLELNKERDSIKRKHAEYFLDLAESAEKEFWGDNQQYWYEKLRTESENFRAALAWTLEAKEYALGLGLVGALRDYWFVEGFMREGLKWTQSMLAHGSDEPMELRAKALNAAGWLSYATGDHAQGKLWNREALTLYRQMNDQSNIAWALIFLAAHYLNLDEYKEGVELCEEGLAMFRALGINSGITRALNHLGEFWRIGGNYERARVVYEECLKMSRESGDKHREAFMLGNLGFVAQHQGDHEEAEKLTKQSLAQFSELGSDYFTAIVLAFLAGPLSARGQYERALILVGASDQHLEKMGVHLQPSDKIEIERYVRLLSDKVEKEIFETHLSKGAEMTLEEAVRYALGDDTEAIK